MLGFTLVFLAGVVVPLGLETAQATDDHIDRTGTGLGLGLAIVHRLITADHGTIRLADSDLGALAAIIELPRPAARGA